MVVFVCVCRSPQVLPETAPAPVLNLTRVVMGAIGRSHVILGENIEKNNFRTKNIFIGPIGAGIHGKGIALT